MRASSKLRSVAVATLGLTAGPAGAAVQVSQSGWQWGNPTPQGNTIRAMDFIAGRGYAIGDDGTALRTDDGGATWTGLATGTSQDLTRVQAVTAGRGRRARRRRLRRAPLRRRRQDVPQDVRARRDRLPGPVAASYFVTPQVGYLLLRTATSCARPTAARRSGAAPRSRARPRAPAAATASPPTRSSPPPTPASCSSPARARLPHDRRRRVVDARARRRPRRNVQRMRAVDATTFYAFGPNTLCARPTPGRPGRPGRGRREHDHRRQLRHARPLPDVDRPRRDPAADRERRRRRRRRSRPRPRRCSPPASPPRPAPWRRASGGATAISTTAAATTCRSAATSPARSSSACGPARPTRSRSRSAPAASSPARPTTAPRGARSTSPPRPTCATRRSPRPTRATRSISAAACSGPPTAAPAGSRSIPAPRRLRAP